MSLTGSTHHLKMCEQSGILTVHYTVIYCLYKDSIFMSYGDLFHQFGLKGEEIFWIYLQIRNV